jgi:hypothetical protein
MIKTQHQWGKAQLHVCSTMFYLSFFLWELVNFFDSCEVLRTLSHLSWGTPLPYGPYEPCTNLRMHIQVSNTWESHIESMCDFLCLDGFHMISPNSLWQHGNGKSIMSAHDFPMFCKPPWDVLRLLSAHLICSGRHFAVPASLLNGRRS